VVGAGLIVIVALAIVLATQGGGSSHKGAGEASRGTSQAPVGSTTSKHRSPSGKSSKPAAKATPPAETPVTVLNGTEAEGLARRVASELQQGGYSQAGAAFGRPPGANEATVVEYAGGHQADAEGVARSLSVSHVQPVEQAVSALAPSAQVVVIVGTDRAG